MSNGIWCKSREDLFSLVSFENLKDIRNRDAITAHLEDIIEVNEYGSVSAKSQKEFAMKFWSLFAIDGCSCDTFKVYRKQLANKVGIVSGTTGGIILVRDYSNEVTAVLKQTFKSLPDPSRSVNVRIYKSKGEYMNPVNEGTELGGRIVSVASDSFANQSIVSLLLTTIVNRLPNDTCYNIRSKDCLVNQFDAFVCNGYGYSLMNVADKGTMYDYLQEFEGTLEELDSLLVSAVKDVCSVFFALNYASEKIGFVHGDLKTKNILVKSTSANGVRFMLADFDKSSLTWKDKVRFHHRGNISTLASISNKFYSESFPFPLKTYRNEEVYTLYRHAIQRGLDLRIIGRSIGLHTMSSPFAFYQSYDIYTFMLSIALHDRVVEHYFKLPKFMTLFESLWVNNKDSKKITKVIERVSLLTSRQREFYQSINILAGLLSNENVFLRKNLTGFYETLGYFPYCPVEH